MASNDIDLEHGFVSPLEPLERTQSIAIPAELLSGEIKSQNRWSWMTNDSGSADGPETFNILEVLRGQRDQPAPRSRRGTTTGERLSWISRRRPSNRRSTLPSRPTSSEALNVNEVEPLAQVPTAEATAARDFAALGDQERVIFTPLDWSNESPRRSRESDESNPFADPTPLDPFSDPVNVIEEVELPAPASSGPTSSANSDTDIFPTLSRVTSALSEKVRSSSVYELYDKAKEKKKLFQRKPWVERTFEYLTYLLILAIIYFVFVGYPLWIGAVYGLYWVVNHKFYVAGTWSVTIGIALIYAYAPLLMLFEDEPPIQETKEGQLQPGVRNTALLIPCYKSAQIIGPTLEAALKIFPASHIFVVANGNSPTPLDDTEDKCRAYGVNHIWSPIGSKIVAQFVGCYSAKKFENVLLIDDDCALPPNFPIVSERMKGKIKCIGYTIKSVGPDSTRGTLCQQAQDLEYKLSGLQRAFAGKIGSATFPHGAISLWNTEFLIKTFHTHPGFSVSEDWFFGHVARQLGSRITMCTAVFVETETPSAVWFSSGGARGGFGEMTVFKQRFYRWNFFFVNGMYYNMKYILGSWKLGFWELGAKLFVFQEVYETMLYLVAPFMLPISLIVRPQFCGYLTLATLGLYFVNVTIFNEVHLRRRNERVSAKTVYLYYTVYKLALTVINVLSCYYAIFKYAKYFAKRHPKVVEDDKAVEVVLKLEEQPQSPRSVATNGRRLTVTAAGTRVSRDTRRKGSFDEYEGIMALPVRPPAVWRS